MAFRTAVAAANGFSLSWSTAGGLTYQVQYKTNLLQADWIDLGTPTVATGSSLTISDANSIKTSSRPHFIGSPLHHNDRLRIRSQV